MKIIILSTLAVLWGCSDSPLSTEVNSDCPPSGKAFQEDSGEHNGEGEGGEVSEDGGEESATQYAKADTFDEVRAGARLVISYIEAAGEFRGTVENTTDATLTNVRVEIHLSTGLELGPTTPVDLAAGEIVEVVLAVPESDRDFTSYGAHPEVGTDSPTVVSGDNPNCP